MGSCCYKPDSIKTEYSNLIAAYNASKVFIVAPPPTMEDNMGISTSLVDELPPLIKSIAAMNGVTFVGSVRERFCDACDCKAKGVCEFMNSDNIHLNDAGYSFL